MDFTNRSSQNQPTFGAQNGSASAHAANTSPDKHNKSKGFTKGFGNGKWGRAGSIIFLVCMVILAAAAICLIAFSGNSNEGQYVKKNQYQAVFLTNGQVYFGHIKDINNQYIDLENIYYLQQPQKNSSGSSTANNNVTLVKLGCELHAPYDQMVIQARQVSFWENIQSSGQVAKGIAKLPKCVPSTPPASQSNATTPNSSDSSSSSDNSSSNSSNSSSSNTNNSSSNTSNSSSSTPSSSTSTKPSTP
jgi:hypothetical protein